MNRVSQFFKKIFPSRVKDEKFTIVAPKPKAMQRFVKSQRLGSLRHAFFGTFRPVKPLPGQRTGWEHFQARERIRRDKEAARYARETMRELRAA